MTHRKINTAKWIVMRKHLRVLENIVHISSLFFSALALVLMAVLFTKLRMRGFTGLRPAEEGLFMGAFLTVALLTVHALAMAYFRARRRILETDIYPVGFLPLHDAESFQDVLRKETRRAGRYRLALTLCIVKLDEFKEITDLHGWAHGKKLFGNFVKLASGVVRSTDYLSHLASDEFAILLCHTDLSQAQKFLYRLYIQTQERMEMTFSSGITAYRNGESEEAFLERAHKALTHAYAEGPKKVHCAIEADDRKNIRNF
ncbi:MAG: GGDEF domain-containing protein [Candidatus Omnitrophota bacterium]